MLGKHRLHLGGVDVLPAAAGHVLGATGEDKEAVGRDPSQVAGVTPAVDERLGRLGRLVPVSGGHGWWTDPDLAGLVRGGWGSVRQYGADLGERHRSAHAV